MTVSQWADAVGIRAQTIYDRLFEGWSERDAVMRTKAVKIKLTEAIVRLIRATPKKYGVTKRLAQKYGVTSEAICEVTSGKTWNHVR